MRGDFHTHTTYSDGSLSVTELLLEASKYYSYLAITDHDCLDGAKEAVKLASSFNLDIIIGVEVTTFFNGESVHVLGYFNSFDNLQKLEEMLNAQRIHRIERCKKIAQLLDEHFSIKLDLTPLYKYNAITRGTIANEIINQGYNYTREEIFSKLIGKNCKAYVSNQKVLLPDAVQLLKECQATVVLAHPGLLEKNDYKKIIEYGFDGIEALYPAHSPSKREEYLEFAKKNNLLVTAGTDFHNYNDYMHGNLGEVYLTGEQLETFIKRIRKGE